MKKTKKPTKSNNPPYHLFYQWSIEATKEKEEAKTEGKVTETGAQDATQAKGTEHSAEYKDPFTYEMLLTRIYNILKANNPALSNINIKGNSNENRWEDQIGYQASSNYQTYW